MRFPPPRRLPWLLLISAVILVADRATKTWVASHIGMGDAMPIIPRVLRLTHWLNDGAAPWKSIDEVKAIAPPPLSRMTRAASWPSRNDALRITSVT